MYFYIIQLYDISYKQDIILALTTVGIINSTIVLGESLDTILSNEIPLFKNIFKSSKKRISAIIFGTTESKEKLYALKILLEEAGIKNTDNIISITFMEVNKV